MRETIELGARELALAALLVLAGGLVGVVFRLGIARRFLLTAVRSLVQLLLLGLVLRWVFGLDRPLVVVALLLAMGFLAGFEGVRRTTRRMRGLYPLSMGVMLASSLLVTLYGTQAVLRVEPWYAPRYLIPILGMVLGNSLNGVALGLEATMRGFERERERVEVLLAHGASPARAGRDVVRDAIRTGLIPILNAMVAAGLLSIPGMMTGQILSGEEPLSAALYQVFILFCIAGAVALGTVGVVLGCTRLLFDERARLRVDRLRPARQPRREEDG